MSTVIPHIIDQHAEEAAFLWLLRNNAIDAPHYDLKDLAKLDDRIDAHLDGLRIAGEYGWQACYENLQIKEPGEVFTAAILALEGQSIDRIEQVYSIVEETPETIHGLVSAFGWVEPNNLHGKVNGLLISKNPLWHRIGLSACAIHRVDPGEFLEQAIKDNDIPLRARALKSVGELGRTDLKPALLEQLNHKNESIQFWAAWSAVLIGDRDTALNLLCNKIKTDLPFSHQAMQLTFTILDFQTIKIILKQLADNKDTLRQAVIGAGLSGDASYIPWLIQHMNNPELAKVAGESFSSLCGVDLAYQNMEGELTDEQESTPTEDPSDENVAMDSDEDLPVPDSILVAQWWEENKNNFKQGIRYLYGKPSDSSQCNWILRNGTQRLRYKAALILASMQANQVLFEVRAIGKRQQNSLTPS